MYMIKIYQATSIQHVHCKAKLVWDKHTYPGAAFSFLRLSIVIITKDWFTMVKVNFDCIFCTTHGMWSSFIWLLLPLGVWYKPPCPRPASHHIRLCICPTTGTLERTRTHTCDGNDHLNRHSQTLQGYDLMKWVQWGFKHKVN